MADSVIKFDTQIMQATAQVIDSKANIIQQMMDQIRGVIDQTASYWMGEAGDLHRSLSGEAIAEIESFATVFHERATQLTQIAGNDASSVKTAEAGVAALPNNVIPS